MWWLLLIFATSQPLEADLTFCFAQVNEPYRSGNASFTEIFAFDVENGSPKRIHRKTRIASGVDEKFVRNCISGWRFGRKVTMTGATALFRWEHGIGWTWMSVLHDRKEILRVRVAGDTCQYKC